jgi:CheY-like chemotaxis protein
VVEDEALVRDLTKRTLSGLGYRVLTAANAGEALERLAAHEGPVDLLVTDVVMPGMSGPKLAEAVADRFPRLTTLFISGYAGDHTGRPLVPDGAALLDKPFTIDVLARRVRELLDVA